MEREYHGICGYNRDSKGIFKHGKCGFWLFVYGTYIVSMFFPVVHDKNNRVSDFDSDCGYCVYILAGSRYTLTNRYTREFVEMEK